MSHTRTVPPPEEMDSPPPATPPRRPAGTGRLPAAGAARARLWVIWFGVALLGFYGQFAAKVMAGMLTRFHG